MFGKLSDLAGKVGGSALSSDAEPKIRQFLAENWPAISAAVKQQLGTVAVEALRDDTKVNQVAKIAYGFVPGMVRMAVSEQAFASYITENRAKVLEWIASSVAK